MNAGTHGALQPGKIVWELEIDDRPCGTDHDNDHEWECQRTDLTARFVIKWLSESICPVYEVY